MFVGAVTGTNGKTSVVEFARQLCDASGRRAASLGNRGLVTAAETVPPERIGGGRQVVPQLVRWLEYRGYDALFFEANSAALSRGLLDHTPIDAAAFTHLSQDHLDVHGTMEAYAEAKKRLFDPLLAPGAPAIFDPAAPGADLVREAARDRGLREVRCGWDGTGRSAPDEAPKWPNYVLSGVELAVALCHEVGVSIEDVSQGMTRLTLPPGRLQDVEPGAQPRVIIDYAHNPGGLETVLRHVKNTTADRVWLVFGCGGGRESRASTMAGIASSLADRVIVTDDNPRFTPPARLRRLLMAGLPDAVEIPDRRDAIREAIGRAALEDVVLVAGKGEEEWIDLGTRRRRHSDLAVARVALAGRGPAAPRP